MDSYDLKSLFDELLRGIREKRAAGKHRGIYWIPQSQLDEERRHENAMALERQKSEGDIDRQRLVNTGNIDVENVRNIGTMARQRLMNEGALAQENVRGTFGLKGDEIQAGAQKYGYDKGLEGHKYTADQTLAGHKYTADRAFEEQQLASETGIKVANIGAASKTSDPTSDFISAAIASDPTIATDPQKWNVLMQNARKLRPAPALPEGDITAGSVQTPPPAREAITGAGKSMVFGGTGSPMRVERPRDIEDFTPWAKKKKKLFDF